MIQKDKEINYFHQTSEHIHLNEESGEIEFDEHNLPTFNINQIGLSDQEMFSMGLEIRMNDFPVLQATERLLLNEVLNSADQLQ